MATEAPRIYDAYMEHSEFNIDINYVKTPSSMAFCELILPIAMGPERNSLRAWWWPHAGPGAGGSPYPYDFLNLPAVGWAQFGIACLKVLAAFLASGAVVCLVDRALPEHPLAK